MELQIKIHAFIISWNGMQEKASVIADSIKEHVNQLTIIYSNEENREEFGPGELR